VPEVSFPRSSSVPSPFVWKKVRLPLELPLSRVPARFGLVKNELHRDPFTGTVFVFRSRKTDRLNLIY